MERDRNCPTCYSNISSNYNNLKQLSKHMNRSVQASNGLKTINRPYEHRNIGCDEGGITCQWRNDGLSINGIWDNGMTIQKRKLDWFHILLLIQKLTSLGQKNIFCYYSLIVGKNHVKSRSYKGYTDIINYIKVKISHMTRTTTKATVKQQPSITF